MSLRQYGRYLAGVDYVSPGWTLVSIDAEGQDVRIAGVSLWEVEWEPVGSSSITVAHPNYPDQRHQISVYRVRGSPEVLIAVGEFSNGVWASTHETDQAVIIGGPYRPQP